MKAAARMPGSVLVWAVDAMKYTQSQLWVEKRPGGLALLVILRPVSDNCSHLPAVRSLRARTGHHPDSDERPICAGRPVAADASSSLVTPFPESSIKPSVAG